VSNEIIAKSSKELNEITYKTKLDNGLEVYICKKPGFKKKIGMFGTKYGSVINHFVDITTGNETRVPDGVAHFLEHKLFEQEGANALDLFSKIGVSSNAYTSFDQTVYFFETTNKYEESIELLVKLVTTPYFTDENVQKEQGIIGQEISMYDDEPNYKVYFNALQAMYKNNPVRIDIAGTIESISHITKETLYTCYNTFYSMKNMFFLVVGDVDIDETLDLIKKNISIYKKEEERKTEEVKVFEIEEPKEINKKEIYKKMDVYMQNLCVGYKLDIVKKDEIIKRQIVADMISDMYFSKLSKFFKEQYSLGLISDEVSLSYEGTKYFSHVVVIAETKDAKVLSTNISSYIDKIKNEDIDSELFNLTRNKKLGEALLMSDSLDSSYRRTIDTIVLGADLYKDIDLLKNIKEEDIKEFLKLLDSNKNMVTSVISAS